MDYNEEGDFVAEELMNERKIGQFIKARLGKLAAELAEEQARHEITTAEKSDLRVRVELLENKAKTMEAERDTFQLRACNLFGLVNELLSYMDQGVLPRKQQLIRALVKARETADTGPFLTCQPEDYYNLRKGERALGRLRAVTELQNSGYSPNNHFYHGKTISAVMALHFFQVLTNLETDPDIYGSFKVLFANPKTEKKSRKAKRPKKKPAT